MKHTLAALLMLMPFSCLAQTWKGKAMEVIDGDTYEVRKGAETITVRLYGIDCPETGQPYGDEATNAAANKIEGRTVTVRKVETGYYGRLIGKVSIRGASVSRYLVSEGLAWVSDRYCNQRACQRWAEIQAKRRNNGIGLWSQTSPVAPWEYR